MRGKHGWNIRMISGNSANLSELHNARTGDHKGAAELPLVASGPGLHVPFAHGAPPVFKSLHIHQV